MEAGILVESIDEEGEWPEDDAWGDVPEAASAASAVDVAAPGERPANENESAAETSEETPTERAGAAPEAASAEPEPARKSLFSPRKGGSLGGLLGLPPMGSRFTGQSRLATKAEEEEAKREAEEAAKREAEEAAKRQDEAAKREEERRAAAAKRAEERKAAAAKRAEERKAARREAEARAKARREAEEREAKEKAKDKAKPKRTVGAGGRGLDRLSSLRRGPAKPSSEPVVVDENRPTVTSPDRTVRVAIRAPTTLPDIGVGQRSFGVRPPPRASAETSGAGDVEVEEVEAVEAVEAVEEVSESMFTEVDASAPKLPRIPPPRPAKKTSAKKKKPGDDKPKFKLPRLPKLPPRK